MSLAFEWWRPNQCENPMVYLDDVYRYAVARLQQREEAEDIAIEVVQSLPNPCRRRDLKLYMIGMARRKIADRLRRKPTLALLESDAAESFGDRSHQAADVESALRAISEEHREVLTLKYMAGLSSREIGRMLGKPPEAIDSMLQRARDAFAKAYDPSPEEVNQ